MGGFSGTRLPSVSPHTKTEVEFPKPTPFPVGSTVMAHHSVLPRIPGCSSTTRPTHMHILLTTFTPSCVSHVSVALRLRSFHHHEFSSLTKSISILPRVVIQIHSGSFLSLCPFLSHLRCGLSLLCVCLICHLWLAPSSSFPVPIPEQRKPGCFQTPSNFSVGCA